MSDWLRALGDRAGPLEAAARAFVERYRADVTALQGAAGVRWLVRVTDDFAADECSDADLKDDDDAFCEGAGALLGALAIDSMGGAHSARGTDHCVSLGPAPYPPGTFDPFVSIREALDADDPPYALAVALREAEAEARGEGPRARCVRAFVDALRRSQLSLGVAHRHRLELTLSDGTEVSLERLMANANPSRAAARIVAMLGSSDRASAEDSWDELRPRLLPRLVGERFLTDLGGRAEQLQWRSLVADISIAIQLRYEGRSRFVRREEVDQWLAAGHDPARAVLANLRDAKPSLDLRTLGGSSPSSSLFALRCGDGLDATRLLLPGLAEQLERRVGRPFLCAVPHRDVLLVGEDDHAAERALRAHARELFARAPHAISETVLQVDGATITAT